MGSPKGNHSAEGKATEPCFEEALAGLEVIVRELEEGQIGLAEALSRYEEGVKLLKQCYDLLDRAERRIEVLCRLGTAGEEITEQFDDAIQSLEEKARSRSQRRSRKTSPDSPAQDPQEGDNEMDAPRGLF